MLTICLDQATIVNNISPDFIVYHMIDSAILINLIRVDNSNNVHFIIKFVFIPQLIKVYFMLYHLILIRQRSDSYTLLISTHLIIFDNKYPYTWTTDLDFMQKKTYNEALAIFFRKSTANIIFASLLEFGSNNQHVR